MCIQGFLLEHVSRLPWASDKPSGRRERAECRAQETVAWKNLCASSDDVVVPGTVIKDLFKKPRLQVSQKDSFPQRSCQNGKKTNRRRRSRYIHGDPQHSSHRVSWEPWTLLKRENMGSGIWGWCLMLSLSQSSSRFCVDGYPGLRGVRLEGREPERNGGIGCCCGFRCPIVTSHLELQE